MLIRACLFSAALLSFAVLSSGCGSNDERADGAGEEAVEESSSRIADALQDGEEPRALVTQARATIEPLGDSGLSGTVTFARSAQGVRLTYNIVGLEPGRYGFHVHENGSCEDGDDGTPGGAAGGHFNPAGAPHGAPDRVATARHAGDLGNLYVLPDSSAVGTFGDPLAELEGENSIIGRALMIHAEEDDFTTQPTGNAGPRIGCGVITGVEA